MKDTSCTCNCYESPKSVCWSTKKRWSS